MQLVCVGIFLQLFKQLTGKVIHCIASDREAAHGNRVVDLSETQFAQLAPLSKGVVVGRVSW